MRSITRGRTHYPAKWKGYHYGHDAWYDAMDLQDVSDLVNKYNCLHRFYQQIEKQPSIVADQRMKSSGYTSEIERTCWRFRLAEKCVHQQIVGSSASHLLLLVLPAHAEPFTPASAAVLRSVYSDLLLKPSPKCRWRVSWGPRSGRCRSCDSL